MKTTTKKSSRVLKDLPKVTTTPDFLKKLHKRIEETDTTEPIVLVEWDEVSFEGEIEEQTDIKRLIPVAEWLKEVKKVILNSIKFK